MNNKDISGGEVERRLGFDSLGKRLLRLIGRGQGSLRIHNLPRTLRESCLANQGTRGLLVVGLSRSGTTILYRLLNAHPAVCLTYESIYMPFTGGHGADEIQAYFYEVVKQSRHLTIALDREHQPGDAKPFTFEQPYAYFGDKVIYNTSRVLRRNLRRAVDRQLADKIVFIVRDSRARTRSVLQWPGRRDGSLPLTTRSGVDVEIADERTIERACAEWNCFMADVLRHCRHESRCTWIKYEDLVTRPGEVMGKVNDFLELDAGRYPDHHLSRVATRSVDTWRSDLDRETVERITRLTRDYLTGFGYQNEER